MNASTEELRALTEAYVEAFNQRDIERVSSLMDDTFVLNDPDVHDLNPKASVIKYISRLFTENSDITFIAKSIVVESPYSVIHFTLCLGASSFDGIDFIHWKGQKMKAMHAYLTNRK